MYFTTENIEVSYRLNHIIEFVKLLRSLQKHGKGFYDLYKHTLVDYYDFSDYGDYQSHPYVQPGTYRKKKKEVNENDK